METTKRTTRILSLSLPPRLLQEAEKISRKEGRTKSELFREALRRYLQERSWQELRRYGMEQTKKLGLKEKDVEKLVKEYRRER